MTVGAYAVEWLADTARTVRPSTLEFYRASLRHLDPIADVPVAALSVPQVRSLMASVADKGRASRTVRGVVQTLALVLRRAMADGLVDRNVASLVKLPANQPKRPPQHWTAAQAHKFLEATKDDPLGPLCALALGTGLRRGEALGLEWRDVDIARGTAAVRRSKTDAGVRVIPLPPVAVEALRRLDRHPGPIWPFRPEYVTRHFQALCRQAKVPVIRFHDLRHTAATLMAEAGVSEETRKWLLGHTNVQMTRHYSHESERLMREAVEKLGEAIA